MRKNLLALILMMVFMISSGFALTGCKKDAPADKPQIETEESQDLPIGEEAPQGE